MTRLLYHGATDAIGKESPFDVAVLRVAEFGPLRIVSPYIGVNYIQRATSVVPEWRIVSDVEEWLSALSTSARLKAWRFIREHVGQIRHCPGVHAKAVIGTASAMFGSANLTSKGILGRTELGAYIDDEAIVAELQCWFDNLWDTSAQLVLTEADAYVRWLDEQASLAPMRLQKASLSASTRAIRASLAQSSSASLHPKSDSMAGTELSLQQVARNVVNSEVTYFSTLQAAFDAASATLAQRNSFEFHELVAAVQFGFPSAGVRDIYFLVLQRTSNHPASVFAADTLNQFVLSSGKFAPSTRDQVFLSLEPYGCLLAGIVRLCSSSSALPVDRLTLEMSAEGLRVTETHLIAMFEQLQVVGLLDLEDRPGALPRYQVRSDFEWEGRFLLFPAARQAYDRLDFSTQHSCADSSSDDDESIIDGTSSRRRVLSYDALPPRDDDYPDRDVLRARRDVASELARMKWAEENAAKLSEKVDAVLVAVLARIIEVGPLRGGSVMEIARTFSETTGVGRFLVEAVLKGDKRFPRIVKLSGTKQARLIQVNEKIEWSDNAAYPGTLEYCRRIFS